MLSPKQETSLLEEEQSFVELEGESYTLEYRHSILCLCEGYFVSIEND